MEHILIIDVDIETCKMLKDILNKEGFVIDTVSNMVEAHESIEKRTPDLILSDVMMEGIEGGKLLKWLKKFHKKTPVIVLNGQSAQDRVIEALEYGAKEYIAKPFFPSNVIKTVNNVLRKKDNPVKVTGHFSPIQRLFRNSYLSMLKSLAIILESKDPYLQEHSLRVTKYAVLIAKELGLSDDDIEIIEHTGQFHDIGKLGVSDVILQKKEKLTNREWEHIKEHPVIGYNILKPLKPLHIALQGVRHHHERFDGTGYPDKLKGNDIPLIARILSIADAYEAITADRPYRSKSDNKKAAEEIIKNAGTQFDSQLVQIFMKALKDIGEI